jgi:hypothetical protein
LTVSALLLESIQSNGAASQVQFFTVETLFTAAGITTAVITVTSVLHSLFPKLSARWFALALSVVFTLLGVSVEKQPYSALTICVAIINALVIYAAAVGVNNVVTSPPAPAATVAALQRSARWWP